MLTIILDNNERHEFDFFGREDQMEDLEAFLKTGNVDSLVWDDMTDFDFMTYMNSGDITADFLMELDDKLSERDGYAYALFVQRNGNTDYDAFKSVHQGTYRDRADFARSYVEGLYEVPDFLQSRIDWDGVANDLAMDMEVVEENGEVFVYNMNNMPSGSCSPSM